MARKFIVDGRQFDDPDPGMTVEQVRMHFTDFFPELSNSDSSERTEGTDHIYTFTKKVGTKGAKCKVEMDIPDGKYCCGLRPGAPSNPAEIDSITDVICYCPLFDGGTTDCNLLGSLQYTDNDIPIKHDQCPNPAPKG